MDNTNKGTNNINKLYENLTYFDQYGTSLILFIIITIILILFIGGCYAMINISAIRADWVNQRCKPYVIPIAGLINRPPGVSIKDFTEQNFNYCSQTILKNMTGTAVEPLNYTTKIMSGALNGIENAINDIRPMFNKSRDFFKNFSENVMGRLLNITVPLQQIVITFKDFISKVIGTLTSGLFTALGTYLTLKSVFGVIAKVILTVLIAIAALIVIFWITPFTYGAAVAATSVFVAASIPLTIMLVFMSKILDINPGINIPRLKKPSLKCFDKNTQFILKNGTKKSICNLQLGEKLQNNSTITAKITVEAINSVMYNLNGIVVSDSHMVKYNNKWIRIDEHPQSIKINNYNEPYLYCINTDNKTIELNDLLFTDWDEIVDEDLEKIKNIKLKNVKYKFNIDSNINTLNEITIENSDIHKYLDGGFNGDTIIKLKNGLVKKIKNINIGDVLENGEKVYGYTEIDGINLNEQSLYNLAKNKFVQGGGNINICDKTINYTSTLDLDEKNKRNISDYDCKLYHLLTNTKTFFINGIKFYDYNSCIDLFLEKYRGKLLSMKYV
jgi:hypothetical protein